MRSDTYDVSPNTAVGQIIVIYNKVQGLGFSEVFTKASLGTTLPRLKVTCCLQSPAQNPDRI